MNNKIKIAIDGPAASGKSSVGIKLANRLGFLFLDTGVMYRAVTWAAINNHLKLHDEEEISRMMENLTIDIEQPTVDDGRVNDIFVDGEDATWKIRQPDVNENVSQVSKYVIVRKILTEKQRQIAESKNIVMVGRDIGTIVLPDAEVKIFLEASLEERARRRLKEESWRDASVTFSEILDNLRHRDEIDSKREIAPLVPAEDSIFINTDGKTIAEVVEEIFQIAVLNI